MVRVAEQVGSPRLERGSMDQRIQDWVEKLEAFIGPDAVLQILFEGSRVYVQSLRIVHDALVNPEGAFAQRVTRFLKERDPEAAWSFVATPMAGTPC